MRCDVVKVVFDNFRLLLSGYKPTALLHSIHCTKSKRFSIEPQMSVSDKWNAIKISLVSTVY